MSRSTSIARRARQLALACLFAMLPAAFVADAVAEEKTESFPAYERSENFVEQSLEGWTLRVHKDLREKDRELGDRALEQARSHLLQVKTRVPAKLLPRLQAVTIWLNVRPGEPAVYHPSRGWLAEHGHNPDKAKCVEIPDANTYLRYSRDQQSILLHELAHAYHDQVLGFDESRIRERFETAKEAGLYDSVLRTSGKVERHYALSNEKEFFAEMTEAFLAANDFYPFVRPELRRHDPETYDLLVEIWEKGEDVEGKGD
ncbi:MAG TPA: metallopeptidase [Pirellulaceae bacterium]|jgi:hypothetical protein|nr:metallopeptidase [Pirellulaceae bacterium]